MTVKGRKEGKDEEIQGEAIRLVSKKRIPNEWDWGQCSLGELRAWEQAKEKRKYREQEKIVRDTHWGRGQWVKIKREFFFFAQVISPSVVISI